MGVDGLHEVLLGMVTVIDEADTHQDTREGAQKAVMDGCTALVGKEFGKEAASALRAYLESNGVEVPTNLYSLAGCAWYDRCHGFLSGYLYHGS